MLMTSGKLEIGHKSISVSVPKNANCGNGQTKILNSGAPPKNTLIITGGSVINLQKVSVISTRNPLGRSLTARLSMSRMPSHNLIRS